MAAASTSRKPKRAPAAVGAAEAPATVTATTLCDHPLRQQQPQLPPAQSRSTKLLRPPSAAVATLIASREIRAATKAHSSSTSRIRPSSLPPRPGPPAPHDQPDELTAISRGVPKVLPRPDLCPDLGRSHFEEERGEGREEGGLCVAGRMAGLCSDSVGIKELRVSPK